MTIEQLRLALRKLQGSDPSWSSVEAQDALHRLDDALEPHSELTVLEFCDRLALTKPKKAKASKPTNTSQPSSLIVDQYLSDLRATLDDPDAFKAVVSKLKKDKSVRIIEAKAIASELTEIKSFKNKTEAFNAILQRQLSHLRTQHRRSHIKDIF